MFVCLSLLAYTQPDAPGGRGRNRRGQHVSVRLYKGQHAFLPGQSAEAASFTKLWCAKLFIQHYIYTYVVIMLFIQCNCANVKCQIYQVGLWFVTCFVWYMQVIFSHINADLLFSATCCYSIARCSHAKGMMSVCPSICNDDGLWSMQQKVDTGIDMIRQSLGYLYAAEVNLDRSILWSQILQRDHWDIKNVVLHIDAINLRNTASYALDQYRTLIGNCIRWIECYRPTICKYLWQTECVKKHSEPVNFARLWMSSAQLLWLAVSYLSNRALYVNF